jgi:hypothetical protein
MGFQKSHRPSLDQPGEALASSGVQSITLSGTSTAATGTAIKAVHKKE